MDQLRSGASSVRSVPLRDVQFALLAAVALGTIACQGRIPEDVPTSGAGSAVIDSGAAGLRLRLATGRIVDIPNDTVEGGDYVRHAYVGIDSVLGYHVIERRLWEAYGYAFVHPTTGRIAHLPERPVVAPDGAHAAVAVMDFDVGYMANEVQVWRVDRDSLALVWRSQTGDYNTGSGWGASNPRWIDPRRVQFDRHVPVGGDSTRMAGTALLVRDGEGWRFEPY